jgi:hypothetical protein
MRYFSIIRGSENQGTPPPALLEAMDRYVAKSLKDGTVVSTGGLAPSAAGIRIRIKSGRITVTDGPFAETKEVLGGYYLIDVETLDEALEWAAKIPSARYGHIEVRPIVMREAEVAS